MDDFSFDDTTNTGIWWSTSLAIRDACLELKEDTNCEDIEIIRLLNSLVKSIEKDGL